MSFISIDPGKNGVAIFLNTKLEILDIYKFDFDKNNILDTYTFEYKIEVFEPLLIVMEKVKGRGGVWGATQNFNFGYICGQILSVIQLSTSAPIAMIEPKTWQAPFHRRLKKAQTAKERTIDAYHRIFPNNPIHQFTKKEKLDQNIVDAYLLGVFSIMYSSKAKEYII